MKNIKQSFLNNLDLLVFVIIIFFKTLGFNKVLNLQIPSPTGAALGVLGSVLIIASILCLFNVKRRIGILFLADLIISIILYVDIVYNRYFHDVTSVALIKQATLVGDVGGSVSALIHANDIIYFIDVILFYPVYRYFRKKISWNVRFNFKAKVALLIVLFGAGLFLCNKSVQGLNENQPGLLNTFYDKKYIVSEIGDLNFHAFDLYRYVENTYIHKTKLTDTQKNDVLTWLNNKNQYPVQKYTGLMKGKNLIIVQLESFQSFVLNRTIEGQEVTPNLDNLEKSSMVFNNYFYETAWGGTSDAEFLSNVSYLPASEGSVYYEYAGNTYDSLAKELDASGYYTTVMHSNRPGFWNREAMYKSLGFDKFYNENDYNLNDNIGLGLSDKSYVQQSLQKMKTFKQPFYSFMITLTSHFPFADPKLQNTLNVGPYEGTLMGDYLKSVKYTDEAIGELIQGLKDQGLWDNSVVVFYGDHAAIPIDKSDLLAKLLYNKDSLSTYEWFNAQKVVSMIHFPGDAMKGVNDMAAGEMDLYPTLANLFGFQAKYAMGRDLLNSSDGYALTRDGNWADNNVMYLKSDNQVVDVKTGKPLDNSKYTTLLNQAEKYFENSDAVIEHDLIGYFQKNGGQSK